MELKDFDSKIAEFKATLLKHDQQIYTVDPKASYKKGMIISFDAIMQETNTIGYQQFPYQVLLKEETNMEQLAEMLADAYVLWCFVYGHEPLLHYIDDMCNIEDIYQNEPSSICICLCRA